MISGQDNPDLEAVLSLTVHGAGGQQQTVEVIILPILDGGLVTLNKI